MLNSSVLMKCQCCEDFSACIVLAMAQVSMDYASFCWVTACPGPVAPAGTLCVCREHCSLGGRAQHPGGELCCWTLQMGAVHALKCWNTAAPWQPSRLSSSLYIPVTCQIPVHAGQLSILHNVSISPLDVPSHGGMGVTLNTRFAATQSTGRRQWKGPPKQRKEEEKLPQGIHPQHLIGRFEILSRYWK